VESSAEVKAWARELGFDTVGIAPADSATHNDAYEAWIWRGFHGEMDYLARHAAAKRNVAELLPNVRSVIAVTLNYYQPLLTGPRKVARYAIGRDYHRVIGKRLRILGSRLSTAHPGATWRACVDSTPVLEREWAHLAGLGWFGKNTMLIDSRRGSWFFIGVLLTDIAFEPDRPSEGGCGTCRACIDACPTGAIMMADDRWQVDARRCISYATIEQRGPMEVDPGEWAFGCDVCQEVCPFNQPRDSQPARAQTTLVSDFRLAHPAAVAIASGREIDAHEWDAISPGSPLRRSTRLP